MVNQILEDLLNEADDYKISYNVQDSKGSINIKQREMYINPVYYEERAETFVHEMLHHYYREISNIHLGGNEEKVVEMQMNSLLKNNKSKQYVLDYLDSRGLR